MSRLFRREPETSEPTSPGERPAPARSSRPDSLIAAGTKVRGEITGATDLVVDGELEGEIRLESDVSVGKEGRVQGDIAARSVRIAGRVVGNVEGSHKVEILPTGRLEGDVVAGRVVLAEGAFLNGKVEMTGGAGASSRAPQPVRAEPPPADPRAAGRGAP